MLNLSVNLINLVVPQTQAISLLYIVSDRRPRPSLADSLEALEGLVQNPRGMVGSRFSHRNQRGDWLIKQHSSPLALCNCESL